MVSDASAALRRAGAEPAVYDSARLSPLLITELSNFWRFRRLIGLLVRRDVLARYKRSMLGVWWTLLNPILTMTVMWLVFSHVFRLQTGVAGVPYVVYVLSGVIFLIFVQQGIEAVAASIVLNAEILKKVYVPAEVFSMSAGLAGAINVALSTIPLLVLQLALGVGVPWTVVLAPVPVLWLLCFVVGFGLLVAALAIRFHDVLDLNRVLVMLLGYLTPTFYPIAIVPATVRHVIELNPVYYDLILFRNLVYTGSLSTWQPWVAGLTSGVAVLALGLWAFARSWRTNAAMI